MSTPSPGPQPPGTPSTSATPSQSSQKKVSQPLSQSVQAQPGAGQRSAANTARNRLKADQNGVLLAAGIMAGVAWVLLYRLIVGSPPLAFQRWLFFILLYVAVTGTVLPFIWYLNQRFSRRPTGGGIILRQGMWFGLFSVTATWLQMTRALTGPIAFFLALSILVIEAFLRIREHPQT